MKNVMRNGKVIRVRNTAVRSDDRYVAKKYAVQENVEAPPEYRSTLGLNADEYKVARATGMVPV